MDRHHETRRTALKIAAVFFAVMLVLSMAFLALHLWEQRHSSFSGDPDAPDTVRTRNGQKYVLKDRVETLLLLGLDTDDTMSADGGFTNDKKADFLLLLVMDREDGSCKAIHIDRDTMTQMNVLGVAGDPVGTVTGQIALSHTYGNGREVSCRNTANAVSTLLGVEIDHYVSVTMDAVPVINNMVGGVTVEVLNDFSQVDATLVQGNTVTLNGEQALTYVRARYGLDDPTNNQRMKRQKQYLEAWYRRAEQCMQSDDGFVSNAALALTDYLVSDCSGNKLESTLSRYAENRLSEVYSLEGELVAGEEHMEFYPDEESIDTIVIDCFYEKAE